MSRSGGGPYAPAAFAPVSILTFGALGDGVNLADGAMTSASAVLTSASAAFTSADVGKVIMVDGAGAAGAALITTIASRQSATQVTLTATAGTTVSSRNVTYGTDDTAAFQSAINATVGTGIDIFLPDRTYIIAGAQQTGTVNGTGVLTGTNWTYSGQLLFPARAVTAAPQTFRLSGRIGPPRLVWGASYPTPTHTQGAILVSTATSGNVFDVIPDPAGHAYSGGPTAFSHIHVFMERLTVRLPNNPQAGGINLATAGSCDLTSLSVDINARNDHMLQPTGSGTGIAMPTRDNSAAAHLDLAQVIGFPIGYWPGEHAVVNECAAQSCMTAMKVGKAEHPIQLVKFLIQDCPTGITPEGTGSAPLMGSLNVQESHNSVWYDTVYSIDDASSFLRGSLEFVNGAYNSLPVRGCLHLNLRNAKGNGWSLNSPLVEGFSRGAADRSYTLGTADTSAHPWNTVSGLNNFGTTNSKAYAPSTGTSCAIVYITPTSYIIHSSITIGTTWTDAGLVTHVLGSNDHFIIELKLVTGGTNTVSLIKRDTGVKTTLATNAAAGLVAGTTYDVEVRCTRYDISLWLDGTQVGSTYTFSSAERTKWGAVANVGLWTFRAAAGAGDDGTTRWNSITTA